jgi:hypothetical protein
MRHPQRWQRRSGVLGAALLALAALVSVSAPAASANHPHSGTWQPHLSHMHDWTPYEGVYDEHFCVEVISGSTHANALASVKRALFSTGTPSWDLAAKTDGTTNARIDIYAKPNPCSSYSQSVRNGIDFEFHVRISNASIPQCGGDDISCVVHDRWVQSRSGTHWHADWAYVYMDRDHLDSNQLINHETGHVFGLMDGGPNLGTGCSPPSIMHLPYYGCPTNNFSKPTNYDIDSVRTIINR